MTYFRSATNTNTPLQTAEPLLKNLKSNVKKKKVENEMISFPILIKIESKRKYNT